MGEVPFRPDGYTEVWACAQPGEGTAYQVVSQSWNEDYTERTILAVRIVQPVEAQLTAEGNGPLLDPDCRDDKHGSCVGGPCECACHREGGCGHLNHDADCTEACPCYGRAVAGGH